VKKTGSGGSFVEERLIDLEAFKAVIPGYDIARLSCVQPLDNR
jgi:hypothetical protein